jgi:hypothetical protein
MKSIFLLIIFNLSLFAINVSNFDIKGIKLGMNSKKAITIMRKYCNNIEIEEEFAYTKCSNDFNFQIDFGYNHLVYRIHLVIYKNYMLTKKQVENILDKLLNKYGKPSMIGKQRSILKKGGILFTACWGNYEKEYIHDNYWQGINVSCSESKYLHIYIDSNPYRKQFLEYKSNKGASLIELNLKDDNLYKMQNINYQRKIKQKEIEERKVHDKEIQELNF